MPEWTPPYNTIEEAQTALQNAITDCALDNGEQAADDAHNDLVRMIAGDCPEEVAEELLRREGVEIYVPKI